VPASDDVEFEDDEILQALTAQSAALAAELQALAGQWSAVTEDQLQIIDVLSQLEARVAALEAAVGGYPAAMPAEPDDRSAREGLRREVLQTSRRTRRLLADSRALITQSEVSMRDVAGLVSEGRDGVPSPSMPPADESASPPSER
jgi:hypothetical protein